MRRSAVAMMASSDRGAPRVVPLRGTQSFVGVMGTIWKRPGLLGLELLWRWSAAVPLLLLAGWAGSRALHGVHIDLAALAAMTAFKPVEVGATLQSQGAIVLPALLPSALWFVPLALVVWAASSAFGRTAIWRRLQPALQARYLVLFGLGLLRAALLLASLALWFWGIVAAGRFAVAEPAARGAEPNLVLYAALLVGLSLLLFMLWLLLSWVLDVAPLFAMTTERRMGASLRAALNAGPLRSKLMETNLVMGIVKVALLVLAMVFSASPLPFETVETQGFLAVWWAIGLLLYLLASDLFQVVRRAAYLQLFQALVTPRVDHP